MIEDAAMELFNNIFEDIFNDQEDVYSVDGNGNQKQLDTTRGEAYINKEQYENQIRATFVEDEEYMEHFL